LQKKIRDIFYLLVLILFTSFLIGCNNQTKKLPFDKDNLSDYTKVRLLLAQYKYDLVDNFIDSLREIPKPISEILPLEITSNTYQRKNCDSLVRLVDTSCILCRLSVLLSELRDNNNEFLLNKIIKKYKNSTLPEDIMVWIQEEIVKISDALYLETEYKYHLHNYKEKVEFRNLNDFQLLIYIQELNHLTNELLSVSQEKKMNIVINYLVYLDNQTNILKKYPGIGRLIYHDIALLKMNSIDKKEFLFAKTLMNKSINSNSLDHTQFKNLRYLIHPEYIQFHIDGKERLSQLDSIYNENLIGQTNQDKVYFRLLQGDIASMYGYQIGDINYQQKNIDYYDKALDLIGNNCQNLRNIVLRFKAMTELEINKIALANTSIKKAIELDSCNTSTSSMLKLLNHNVYGDVLLEICKQKKGIKYCLKAEKQYVKFYNGLQNTIENQDDPHVSDIKLMSAVNLINLYKELLNKTNDKKWLNEALNSISKTKYHQTLLSISNQKKEESPELKYLQSKIDSLELLLEKKTLLDKISSPLNENIFDLLLLKLKTKDKLEDNKVHEKPINWMNSHDISIPKLVKYCENNNTQLIEYLFEGDLLYSFVIRPDTVYLDSKPIDSLGYYIDDCIKTFTSIPKSPSLTFAQKKSNQYVYQVLIKNHISPIYDNIVIVPHGKIASFPFEALIINENALDSPKYLIDNYNISYTYHLSSLKNDDNNNKLETLGFLSITDKKSYNDKRKKIVPELLGSYNEVVACRNITKQFEPSVFTGYKADKKALQICLKSDIAHIATHAFSSSTVKLDNYIYIRERTKFIKYYGFNLPKEKIKSKLVILSACETGTGVYSNEEGVYSFSRYLISGGVPSIIKTLWEINDKNSYIIMENLYKNILQKQHLSLSVNNAKRKLKLETKYKHPYYWAGYVLDGNPFLTFKK